jgi:outer membrane protein OmpA-like peptidoglycan-associated protein
LLVSIPLTNWLTDPAINHLDSIGRTYSLPAITYPKLWYASLTIGIRFPFSLGSTATGYAASESREAATSSGAGTETRAEIDAEGKVPLTGRVSDNSGKSVDANITVVDLTNNEVVATDKTGSDGRYSVRVKAPGRYSVTADADGYLFGTAYFEVDKDGRILSSHPDIKLSETTNGRTRLLVFFDFNSSELKSSSYPELNRAVKLMKAVPTMQVEIAGYTDSVGSVEFNKSLSERRANAVKDYLVKNGIAKKRVAAKGYGEESPIADNGTDEGRAENRRVELVVLSK